MRSPRLAVVVGLLVSSCTASVTPPASTTTPVTSELTDPGTTSSNPSTVMPPEEHRIGVRLVDGVAEFFDQQTGEKFVPRGMNYNRFLTSVEGGIQDNVFSTLHYDGAVVDADLSAMSELGFNVVRVMLETCGVHVNGCVTDSGGKLNPAYFHNVADFLQRAKAHGLYVMVASNTLPDDGYWINATASLQDEEFGTSNNEFLNPASVPIYVDYWESVVTALIEAGAPMDAIWAYELRQEHHFDLAAPPLSLDAGLVETANGLTYDMSDSEDKNRMIDEGLVYWSDTIRDAIRVIDPTALVTVGFFVPNEPNQVMGPDDTRLVRTRYFLRNTSVDFVDLHHYAGNGVDDDEIWENFGLTGVDDIPIVLGEQGAIAPWYSTEQAAAAAVLGLEVASCQVGFDGWLVWGWRGDEAHDIWWASDGDGLIAEVVAPLERPDPCAYGDFDFISFNVAPDAEITASSTADGFPPGNVADGTPAYWNSSDVAPQWVELRLAHPTDLTRIVLTLAQDPPGPSTHELWVAQNAGDPSLVETFDGATTEGDVLVFDPSEPLLGVTMVRVVTTSIGDIWPAWHEIELLTQTPPD